MVSVVYLSSTLFKKVLGCYFLASPWDGQRRDPPVRGAGYEPAAVYCTQQSREISSTRERCRFQEARGDAYYFYGTINTIVTRIAMEDYKHTYLPTYLPPYRLSHNEKTKTMHTRSHAYIDFTHH